MALSALRMTSVQLLGLRLEFSSRTTCCRYPSEIAEQRAIPAVMAPSLSPAATVRAAAIIQAKPSVTIIVLVILYNMQGSRILRPVAVPRLHIVAIFLDRTVFARAAPGVVDRIHRSEQLGKLGIQ